MQTSLWVRSPCSCRYQKQLRQSYSFLLLVPHAPLTLTDSWGGGIKNSPVRKRADPYPWVRVALRRILVEKGSTLSVPSRKSKREVFVHLCVKSCSVFNFNLFPSVPAALCEDGPSHLPPSFPDNPVSDGAIRHSVPVAYLQKQTQ